MLLLIRATKFQISMPACHLYYRAILSSYSIPLPSLSLLKIVTATNMRKMLKPRSKRKFVSFFFLSSHNLLGEKNNSANKGQILSSSSSQKYLEVATEHNETKWEIITTPIFVGFAPVNPMAMKYTRRCYFVNAFENKTKKKKKK